jgi:GT2 family glycosyltransferase
MSMKVLVGVPSAGHPHIDFVNSLLQSAQLFSGVMIVPRLPVHQARTRMAQAFLEQDYTHLFMIDDDMVFTPNDIAQVLAVAEQGKDIVSGLFCRRSQNKPVPVVYDDKLEFVSPPTEVGKVYSTSLAFTVIRRVVLKDIEGEFSFGVAGFGEDQTFALEVNQLGYEWWINPAARVGHKSEITLYA